jgi:hypothetical protein
MNVAIAFIFMFWIVCPVLYCELGNFRPFTDR